MRMLRIIAEAVAALFANVPDAPAQIIRNRDEYGEELAWLGGSMDGFELHDEGNAR